MEFSEVMIWKAVIFLVIVAIYEFWKGFTGRD
jgi:hypothetical protein